MFGAAEEHADAVAFANHVAYLERDGVARDGGQAQLFGATEVKADAVAFAKRGRNDRHHFRFMIGPEDAAEMTDLKAFTRDLRLRWSAILVLGSTGSQSAIASQRNNTHGTVEREVLYPSRPWFGRVVHAHHVVRRGSEDVLHCSLDETGEQLELPPWMFDRAACSRTSMAASPRVNAAVLVALKTLLADSGFCSDPLRNSGAGSNTCDPNGGDGDDGSEATSTTTDSTQSFRGVRRRASSGDADLAASARRRSGGGNKADCATPNSHQRAIQEDRRTGGRSDV
jgi:hypothetical protein